MMTLQILEFVYFIKAQKSRYLENETLFFLQIKKFFNYTSRATLLEKNTFIAEMTREFKTKDSCNFYKDETTLKI